MIPAVRLVPPGHTLVTPGKRFFGGLAHYHDRAPRGARRVGGRLRRSLSSHPPSIPCMRFALTRLCCYPSFTPFTKISLPQAGDKFPPGVLCQIPAFPSTTISPCFDREYSFRCKQRTLTSVVAIGNHSSSLLKKHV